MILPICWAAALQSLVGVAWSLIPKFLQKGAGVVFPTNKEAQGLPPPPPAGISMLLPSKALGHKC